jgi:hypothetical protein
MRPVFARTTAILCALLLSGCGRSTRVPVEWTATPDEIRAVVSGPPEGILEFWAGSPNGPNVIRGHPHVWSTVGPGRNQTTPGTKVASSVFDASGAARASFPRLPIPPGSTLLQGVVLAKERAFQPVAVTDCMIVTWTDSSISVRPHRDEVFRSAVWGSLVAVAAIACACAALRRIALPARRRKAGLVLLFAGAACLAVPRIIAPDIHRTGGPDQPEPIFPPRSIAEPDPPDPIDRMTVPGFHELVRRADSMVPAQERITIVPQAINHPSRMASWQAAWLLWPHPARVSEEDPDPFRMRGVYLTFDEGPSRPGARVIWKNEAGCVWALEEPEGR